MYFGATGSRPGVIDRHEDIVFDDALGKLPAKAYRRLDKSKAALATDIAGLEFIGRLVADDRAVAPSRTAFLSLLPRLQMTLFVLRGLMDIGSRYKDAAMHRIRTATARCAGTSAYREYTCLHSPGA